MLSIVESIEGIVEALRDISRCNDDPGKLAMGSVEREPQIRLFRPRWESCGGTHPLPYNNHTTRRPPYFCPPPSLIPHPESTTPRRRRRTENPRGGTPSHLFYRSILI